MVFFSSNTGNLFMCLGLWFQFNPPSRNFSVSMTDKVQIPQELDNKISSELLINVIRTLTSTISDDQRELERSRLEKGFEQSGQAVDRLLKEHRSDVGQSLGTFRRVSTEITTCREQIRNVKNALHTCKVLMMNRRDDLKKLWAESAEQRKICEILQQIDEIKRMDVTVGQLIREGNYRNAVDSLKRADILLNGPLSEVEGLRTNVSNLSQCLFDKIVLDLSQCLITEPFEIQIVELIKSNRNDPMVAESQFCASILTRYSTNSSAAISLNLSATTNAAIQSSVPVAARRKSHKDVKLEESLQKKIVEAVEALNVFDQMDAAFEHIFMRMPALCVKSINDTILVIQLLVKTGSADQSHLAQLVKMLINQMRECAQRFDVAAREVRHIRGSTASGAAIGSGTTELVHRYWELLQDVFEQVLSEHLGIWRRDSREDNDQQSSHATGSSTATRNVLFSFANTSFVSSANSSLKKRQLSLLCQPNEYNVTAVFHPLNRFCAEIESQLGVEPCRLTTYLHSFVMDSFVERVRADMEAKMEHTLNAAATADFWATQAIPSHNVRVLTSCLRVYELCEEISDLVRNIESYTQRFASLWLLIIAHYTKTVSDRYSQIIKTRSHGTGEHGDVLVECPKISAAWAVDEDISRLLKSLPSWTMITQSAATQGILSPLSGDSQTPMTAAATAGNLNLNESELDIRARTQRESEILIGNLGSHKQIKRSELIIDMDHVKSLICVHESLQWFTSSMRRLIASMSAKSREIIRCRIQMTTINGQLVEELLSDALEDRIDQLENMSGTCLLMLYLELRIHCFYHLLPLARSQTVASLGQDESDRELLEFGRDLSQFHQTLQVFIVPTKLKYLFDGLGHLCASIFIHSSQFMIKLTDNGRKRICRSIFGVQKYLSQLSGRPETELNRALTFYELLNNDPDQLLAHILEKGLSFTFLEYTNLLSLAVRSHPVLCSQPGALETRLSRLRESIQQRTAS